MAATNFSTWIKEQLKKKAGWTFGTLSEKAKISRAAAYFYRDGLRVPNTEALAKIAVALGLNGMTKDTTKGMTDAEIISRAEMPQFAPKLTK